MYKHHHHHHNHLSPYETKATAGIYIYTIKLFSKATQRPVIYMRHSGLV